MPAVRRIADKMVVMPKATRAGTTSFLIQKQHQESATRMAAGANTDERKYFRRRLKEKVVRRLAKEPRSLLFD